MLCYCLCHEGKSHILDMSMELTDVLFGYFGRTFTARELVRLKCVSKVWKMLICDNMAITTQARVEDNTKDWYFPLRFHKQSFGRRRWLCWELWTWCGIHHSVKEIHRLPSLPCFHSPPSQHVDIFLGTQPTFYYFYNLVHYCHFFLLVYLWWNQFLGKESFYVNFKILYLMLNNELDFKKLNFCQCGYLFFKTFILTMKLVMWEIITRGTWWYFIWWCWASFSTNFIPL